MSIIELEEKEGITENVKLNRIYVQFQEFLKELRKKELPHKIIEFVNQDIEDLNSTSLLGNELRKLVKQKQEKIIKLLEKELKIVPKDYYQNFWLALGMCVFGIPLGVVLGTSLENMGLLGIGIPIGLAIGSVLGSRMDKKASEEGRQLDVKIKY
jgi:hypothetical protein